MSGSARGSEIKHVVTETIRDGAGRVAVGTAMVTVGTGEVTVEAGGVTVKAGGVVVGTCADAFEAVVVFNTDVEV